MKISIKIILKQYYKHCGKILYFSCLNTMFLFGCTETTVMSLGDRARLFRADAVWFPVLDEFKLRDILNQGWSDEQIGKAVRHLLMPVYASCVPNHDLWAIPPKYTTWHYKLDPWACAKDLVWARDLSNHDIVTLQMINKYEAEAKIALRHSENFLPFAGPNGTDLEFFTVRY